jgi:hypothetical protein
VLGNSIFSKEARMPQIFVNTDNSDPTNKLYNASKLGKSATAAEKKIQDAVEEAISKTPDFTTDKSGKGYSLRMKVLTEAVGRATRYTVTIEIIRYPKTTGKGGKGEELVPTMSKPGSATVEGASEADILDAIGQLAQSNVKASLGVMRIDMTRR